MINDTIVTVADNKDEGSKHRLFNTDRLQLQVWENLEKAQNEIHDPLWYLVKFPANYMGGYATVHTYSKEHAITLVYDMVQANGGIGIEGADRSKYHAELVSTKIHDIGEY